MFLHSQVELEVGFEPSAIGESLKDTLVVSSAVAGEYHIPLVGRCVPPKPQGPIELSKVRDRGGGEILDCTLTPYADTSCHLWVCTGQLAMRRNQQQPQLKSGCLAIIPTQPNRTGCSRSITFPCCS